MRRKLGLILFLLIYSLNAFSQKKDSVYYLIDTLNTPKNSQIWEIGIENPFKYYTIKCPCLEFGRSPTFIYRPDMQKAIMIKQKELKLFKQTNLSGLIQKAKEATNKDSANKYTFFIIEPKGKLFIINKVGIIQPRKIKKLIDYENISHDTAKAKKLQ